jgi:hypothetical protein
LFFTSAKTGMGMSDVFAYIAYHIIMHWEWEEAHLGEPALVGNGSTMHLGNAVSTHMHQAAKKAHCSASIIPMEQICQ